LREMPHRLPTTSYAILGLLIRKPTSRYELAQLVERTIAHFWTIAKSQVYRELDRLETLGYVHGTHVHQKRLPDKRVYAVTPAGERAFDAWLQVPDAERTHFRSAYLVKVFFANRMPSQTLIELLRRYRDGNQLWLQEIDLILAQLSGNPEAVNMRATALLGAKIAEAMVAWADGELKRAEESRRPQRTAGRKPSGRVGTAARASKTRVRRG
jgi:PadR family transcriptional regulator, regulatory protein AphA